MQWDLPLGTLIAEEAPNGKVFVRRNGRIVAPPLAPSDAERVFNVDGEELRLWRNGATLELEVLPRAAIAETLVEAAPVVEERDSVWQNMAIAYEPPASVIIRARVYFAVAVLIFIISSLNALRIHRMREVARQYANRPVIGDEAGFNPRAFARFEAVGAITISGLAWVAFFAAMGMAGAGFLIRGFRWASPVLEIVTWLMLIFHVFTVIRIDRLVHTQLHAAYDPVPAANEIARLHGSSLTSGIFVALIIGGLLHLVGRHTVERLYEQESY